MYLLSCKKTYMSEMPLYKDCTFHISNTLCKNWGNQGFVLNVTMQKVRTSGGYVLLFLQVRTYITTAHVVYASIFLFRLPSCGMRSSN